jgi:DNA polymerase (family X)
VAPEQLFQSIPGVGLELARRLHEHLDVDTLETLEVAAHDGRLEEVPGIGSRRAAMLRASLAGMLARTRPVRRTRTIEPEVDLLLDVDRQYREEAGRDALPKIAPRRFNPTADAWLPILHSDRGDWHFTALFSNTARAHEFGRSRDWVVIYFHQNSGPEGQRTVVTETRGPAAGSRVVRGRETECMAHLERTSSLVVRGA